MKPFILYPRYLINDHNQCYAQYKTSRVSQSLSLLTANPPCIKLKCPSSIHTSIANVIEIVRSVKNIMSLVLSTTRGKGRPMPAFYN